MPQYLPSCKGGQCVAPSTHPSCLRCGNASAGDFICGVCDDETDGSTKSRVISSTERKYCKLHDPKQHEESYRAEQLIELYMKGSKLDTIIEDAYQQQVKSLFHTMLKFKYDYSQHPGKWNEYYREGHVVKLDPKLAGWKMRTTAGTEHEGTSPEQLEKKLRGLHVR